MAKFCVFCGERPEGKTKEHILPRWLIALTGDPNRLANFGTKFDPEPQAELRQFAFDQFTFPACDVCNNAHAKLEGAAKPIVEKLLREDALSPCEISTLLDWMDKVRVGLWLGFLQLNRNPFSVPPSFHIAWRIGKMDRALIVQKSDATHTRLNFTGADSLTFAFVPSIFSLTVNNFCLTNISSALLLARRLGFPYPAGLRHVADSTAVTFDLQAGRERVMYPVLKRPLPPGAIGLYQPMFPSQGRPADMEAFLLSAYDTAYVRGHSLDFNGGVGAIFLESHGTPPSMVPDGSSITLAPSVVHRDRDLSIRTVIETLELQNWLSDVPVSADDLPDDSKKLIRMRKAAARRYNSVLMERHRTMLKHP